MDILFPQYDLVPHAEALWQVVLPRPVEIWYGDPAWHFQNWGGRKPGVRHSRTRGAAKHYYTMSIDQICALPVKQLSADNAVLFLWVSWPQLEDAIRVIHEWGFKFKTRAFTWVKPINAARTTPLDVMSNSSWRMTQGYSTRANDEVCLLATRGDGLRRVDFGVRSLVVEPIGRHSSKPHTVYDRIERLYGPGYHCCELYARNARPDWYSVGYDVNDGADIREVLGFHARRGFCHASR